MLLPLSASLHYPITVTALLVAPGEAVDQGTPLFSYAYRTRVTEGDELGGRHEVERTFPTRFESPVSGTLLRWTVEKGDELAFP